MCGMTAIAIKAIIITFAITGISLDERVPRQKPTTVIMKTEN